MNRKYHPKQLSKTFIQVTGEEQLNDPGDEEQFTGSQQELNIAGRSLKILFLHKHGFGFSRDLAIRVVNRCRNNNSNSVPHDPELCTGEMDPH